MVVDVAVRCSSRLEKLLALLYTVHAAAYLELEAAAAIAIVWPGCCSCDILPAAELRSTVQAELSGYSAS
jgi:hypothetical protein